MNIYVNCPSYHRFTIACFLWRGIKCLPAAQTGLFQIWPCHPSFIPHMKVPKQRSVVYQTYCYYILVKTHI